MSLRLEFLLVIGALALVVSSPAQELPVPDPEVVHPNIRVSVPNLSPENAADESSGAVAQAAMATVLSASNMTCDSASQLNAVLEANGGTTLRTLAEKLRGASCMTNGTIVHLSAEFTPNASIQPDSILAPILHGRPLLLRWNGELYVLRGVIYDEHLHNSGNRENVIRELLLIDPRYSDRRRFVSFDRQKNDFSEVEGIAEIRFVLP